MMPSQAISSAAAAACACSSALRPPSMSRSDDDYTLVHHLAQPSLGALHSLSAIPAGLVKVMNGRIQKRKVPGGLISDGQICSKTFNELAARPVPRNGLSLEQGITLEMTYEGSLFTSSVTVPVGAAAAVVLSSFTGATALTSVFDQYRFDQIEVWLEPVAAQGTTVFGNLITAVDLDDVTVPASAAIADRQGAIQGYGGAGRYHKWKPHMAVAVYSGAFTSFANETAGWIDSASPNVQHYGFKTYALTTPVAITYNITVRAVLSFRAPNNS